MRACWVCPGVSRSGVCQMSREALAGEGKVLAQYPFAAHFCAGIFAESFR